MKNNTKSQRGGFREGAGRPKTQGTRHTWVVPEDVEKIVSERGTGYIWDAVRFKFKLDATMENEKTKEAISDILVSNEMSIYDVIQNAVLFIMRMYNK